MTDEAAQDETRMPLWEHLDELRTRLVRALLILAVGFVITYNYADVLVRFLEAPLLELLPEGEKNLYFTGLADKFVIYLQISVLADIALFSPYLLWELWGFIAPGLYQRERRFAGPFVFLGTFSFFVGLAFAYYIVIPSGYKFLVEFGSPTDKAIITLTEYFNLTLKLMLAMGIVFELPTALILLGKFGIVTAAMLSKWRKHAYLAIAMVAGIATPSPDAFSMVLVMVPLILLYEISIWGIRWTTPVPQK